MEKKIHSIKKNAEIIDTQQQFHLEEDVTQKQIIANLKEKLYTVINTCFKNLKS